MWDIFLVANSASYLLAMAFADLGITEGGEETDEDVDTEDTGEKGGEWSCDSEG